MLVRDKSFYCRKLDVVKTAYVQLLFIVEGLNGTVSL